MALYLSNNNHVTVLAGIPNYPTGNIYPGYSLRWMMKETIDRVNVIRTFVVPLENAGFFRRSVNYVSYFISGLINGIKEIRKPDVIIASSPQLLTGLLGLIISRIKKAKFILDIRDIWPDSIVAMGLLQKGPVLSLLRSLERKLYRGADRIIVISEGMKEQIHKKNVPIEKISVLPNCVDIGECKKVTSKITLNIPSDHFIACYAGNHSKAQNIEQVFESAVYSERKHYPISYIFIGEGEEKEKMVQCAQVEQLKNIHFIPHQKFNKLLEYIALSDICITSLMQQPLFYSAIPTKTLEYMSCEKPVLFFGNNFFGKIIEEKHMGVYVNSADISRIPEAIVSVCSNEEKKNTMGKNGRQYIEKHYSLNSFNEGIQHILEQL
ncbi:glycosyltransferase family 4 protein [Patescibacteria group bacterium]